MANWRQEVAEAVIGIEDVNRNSATVKFKIDTLDDFITEGGGSVTVISRTLIFGQMDRVKYSLTDGNNILATDMQIPVAFIRWDKAHDTQQGDPAVIVNGVAKSLRDVRPVTAQGCWGVEPGIDTLTVGGSEYTVIGIVPEQFLDNAPARLSLILRGR